MLRFTHRAAFPWQAAAAAAALLHLPPKGLCRWRQPSLPPGIQKRALAAAAAAAAAFYKTVKWVSRRAVAEAAAAAHLAKAEACLLRPGAGGLQPQPAAMRGGERRS